MRSSHRSTLSAIGLALAISLPAQHCPAAQEGDGAELLKLMATLDKYTEIATKSKLNSDFVPGIVTVLDGHMISATGAATAWQALRLIPGVEISTLSQGDRLIFIRGVGSAFVSGQIKLMVNGISQNSALNGQFLPVMNMPANQIKRIEVIRGPGSALYGEWGYAGVVNIITHEDQPGAFIRQTSERATLAGVRLIQAVNDNKAQLALNLSATYDHGAEIESGPDVLHAFGSANISNAPGKSNERRNQHALELKFTQDDFSLSAQQFKDGSGDHFGVANALSGQQRIMSEHINQTLDVGYTIELSANLEAKLSAGLLKYRFNGKDFFLYPPGFAGIYTDGMNADFIYDERQHHAGIELYWQPGAEHRLLAGLSARRSELRDAWQRTNFIPSSGVPLAQPTHFSGSENWIEANRIRRNLSLYLQDEYQYARTIKLVLGVRHDDYKYISSNTAPRLAAIWNRDDRHIFKLQYAGAFRPPTLLENFGRNNPLVVGTEDLAPAKISTTDLGYIYKAVSRTLRATLFHSQLERLIITQNRRYVNSGQARTQGLELEWEESVSNRLQLAANVSFNDTLDKTGNAPLADTAGTLANINLFYELAPTLNINGGLNHIGKRHRSGADTRPSLDGHNTADLTLAYSGLADKALTLSAGVRNVFDEEIINPAPVTTYAQDYPRPGRQWWLQLEWHGAEY